MTQEGTKRKAWLDACRGIAMIFVLLGHNDPPFIRFIYGFHIPLFYIISGYLFKSDDNLPSFKEMLGKVIKRYIMPYYVLAYLNLLLHVILLIVSTGTHPDTARLMEYIRGAAIADIDTMPRCGPLWFLFSIGLAQLVFWAIRKINKMWLRIVVLLGGSAVWYFLSTENGAKDALVLPFSLHTVWTGVIFLEVGYIIRRYELIERISNTTALRKIIVFVLSFAAGTVGIIFNPVNPRVDISYGNIGSVILMLIGSIGISYALMCAMSLIKNEKVLAPFAYVGRHTIFLMAFDWFSNDAGGQILIRFMKNWEWWVSFITRAILLALMLALWQLIILPIRNDKVKKTLNI